MSQPTSSSNNITTKILIGMITGLIVGVLIQVLFSDSKWFDTYLVNGLFQITGGIFVRVLEMLVVPLVLVSLVCGVCSLADPSKLGRVGGKALCLYLLTTAIAITLALTAATVFKPGEGANPTVTMERQINDPTPFTQVITNIVPDNIIKAMANGDMLPIIVFAILLGLSITFAGESGRRIGDFFRDMNEVIMKLVTIVMRFAPYGVFALIAKLAATTDIGTFTGVLKYIVLVMVMLIIHAALVYPMLLKLFTGLSPKIFLTKMRSMLMFAFSTASSNATIPVTLRTVEERLGVNNKIASFTVPMGATINMDGTAIMQGIATGFIAQYYGIALDPGQYLVVVLMVIMASIGAAGVPSVGLVLLAGVLAQVGLPPEGIALILGVDRILDMTRTAVNVTGDAVVTCIVANSEGELDKSVFHDKNAGVISTDDPQTA